MNLALLKKKYRTQGIFNMRILFTILLISVYTFGNSQSKDLEKADKLYKSFNYSKAITAYKKLLSNSENTYYSTKMIGNALSKQNKSEEAILWYKKCLDFTDSDAEVYLRLGQELLKLGERNEASVYFHKYYLQNNVPHQLATVSFIEYYNELLRDSTRYVAIPLTINTKYDEIGPAIYGDEMVFSSNRPLSGLSKRSDVQTGKSFFNLFKVDKTSPEAQLFSKELQTKYNDGPVCFSKNLKTAYITRNTNFNTKEVNTLDVFVSRREGEEWSKDVMRLPIRKGAYTVAHAYLTRDEKFIFFSSDMPGGFGGMDLYVCEVKNGFLSQPTNLGKQVNTPGNEIFPFTDANGTLYFSSDMHPGIGGYDLFFSSLINGQYTIPFNLGYPVNSSADDFSLVLDQSNRIGFFASNREGGAGGDDIYALQLIKPLSYCIIEANVYSEKDSLLLSNAHVNITDVATGVIMSVKSNNEGKFNCYLKKDKKYTFEVRREMYTEFKGVLAPEELQKYDVLKLNIGLKEK